jgi:hypothetical protein
MTSKWRKLDTIVEGVALVSSAAAVTGFVAATVAILCGDRYVTGLCLVAALVSLGLLANMVFVGVRRANERCPKEARSTTGSGPTGQRPE